MSPGLKQLRVLVTNDDGVSAPGLDAVVQALRKYGLDVSVVAPATDESGTGGKVTGGALTATDATTASGYPAKAVAGTPADSVIWALDQGGLHFVPDLVVSGANRGANLGPAIDGSGTVGAARAAAVHNIPSIAVSAGYGDPIDYAAAVRALLSYLQNHLDEITAHHRGAPVAKVISINSPTCAVGKIRGTVSVPLATDERGFDHTTPVDCKSTLKKPTDDIEAFVNGFVAVSRIPLHPSTGN